METLSCILLNVEGCKGATFSEQETESIQFLVHTSESCTLHPGFSPFSFRRKITKIDRAVIPSEVVDWNLIRDNFSNLGTLPCTLPDN